MITTEAAICVLRSLQSAVLKTLQVIEVAMNKRKFCKRVKSVKIKV